MPFKCSEWSELETRQGSRAQVRGSQWPSSLRGLSTTDSSTTCFAPPIAVSRADTKSGGASAKIPTKPYKMAISAFQRAGSWLPTPRYHKPSPPLTVYRAADVKRVDPDVIEGYLGAYIDVIKVGSHLVLDERQKEDAIMKQVDEDEEVVNEIKSDYKEDLSRRDEDSQKGSEETKDEMPMFSLRDAKSRPFEANVNETREEEIIEEADEVKDMSAAATDSSTWLEEALLGYYRSHTTCALIDPATRLTKVRFSFIFIYTYSLCILFPKLRSRACFSRMLNKSKV
ncbi:unnamed protein product [Protopolystoma xenopodis]|uniref:Uncharacterized protein n=1 Tax=Protopolystoma xenopodis TaxID=117903 RepID=A0A3S5AWH9_9PLAT|nr:unnamed protein product [Protopolystoma xenopodis]